MATRRARNEGSIFKRKRNGRTVWVGEIDLGFDRNGKRKRRTVYATTQREAREKLHTLRAKVQRHVDLDAGQQTVGSFLNRWLDEFKAPDLKYRTAEGYRQVIDKHIMSYAIARVKIEKLHPTHIVSWHAEMRAAEVGQRTQQRSHAVLRAALKTATMLRAIDVSPVEAVPPPRYKTRERPTLDYEEVKRFLGVLNGHLWEAFVKLGLLHGLRLGEVAGLRWQDVDLKARLLRVEHTLVEDNKGNRRLESPKTEQSRREVPLSEMATDALRRHRARVGALPHPGALVFCNSVGAPIRRSNFTRRVWAPLSRSAGLESRGLHFHDLRHVYATTLIANGEDIATVAALLGHTSPATTLRIYSHALPSKKRSAADRVDELFGA